MFIKNYKFLKPFLLTSIFVLIEFIAIAQFPVGVRRKSVAPAETNLVDYSAPKDYIIGGITVSGIKFLDANTLISVSGLNVNDQISIPGERISTAIRRLKDQGIIEDVSIDVTKVEGKTVFLELNLRERPRLNKMEFKGIRKGEKESVEEKIKTYKGKVITDAMVKNLQTSIKKHFKEKGFLKVLFFR